MFMRMVRSSQLLTAVSIGVLIGMIVAHSSRAELQAARDRESRQPFTMEMRIGANLYLQTSAEYEAACLQVYRLATERLHQVVDKDPAKRQQQAVIMDLDETVFDNSAFQTYLYRTHQEFNEELWANYEKNYPQDVALIPGAKHFIDQATALGVKVMFLSNRLKQYQTSTISALERLEVAGVDVESRLYLKSGEGNSDKTSRREAIAKKYQVLLLLGDNLRDFSELFVSPKLPESPSVADLQDAMAVRKAEVQLASVHWGVDWFIVPNPVYGEWDKLIKVDPLKLMHPTSMVRDK